MALVGHMLPKPSLVVRKACLEVGIATCRAMAGTASSVAVVGRTGCFALSRDLLEHLGQISCADGDDAAHGRLPDGDHQAWKETDLMFVPLQRGFLEQPSIDLADRLRTISECTLGTILSATTAVDRSSTLELLMTKSSMTCSLDRLRTAQQMIDLQVMIQKRDRCIAGMVSSNLTAGTLTVYHPLTDMEDLVTRTARANNNTASQ